MMGNSYCGEYVYGRTRMTLVIVCMFVIFQENGENRFRQE